MIEFILAWIVAPLIFGFLLIGFMAISWMLLNYLEENKDHPLARLVENPYGLVLLVYVAGIIIFFALGYFDFEPDHRVIKF